MTIKFCGSTLTLVEADESAKWQCHGCWTVADEWRAVHAQPCPKDEYGQLVCNAKGNNIVKGVFQKQRYVWKDAK